MRRWRRLERWLLLIVLLSGLFVGASLGAWGQASSQALPPEAKIWARQAVEQLGVAIREAVFAWPATELDELKLRAGRVLNVLVGRESPDYQGRLGDPPGSDGIGIVTHLKHLQEAIEPRAQQDERLRPLLLALNAIQFYINEARQHLQTALKGRDLHRVQRTLRQSLAFLIAARGSSEDPLSEGGARALLIQLSRF